MPQPARKPLNTITCLRSTLVLAAIAGCDAQSLADSLAPRKAPAYVEPLVPLPVPDSCLTSATLVFHHDDGTSEKSEQVSDLAQLTRPGDLVELQFTWAPGCGAEHDRRLTFAAYTDISTNGAKASLKAYDVHTARFDAGGSLYVRVPECAYEVDLAFGEPLPALGAGAPSYVSEQRSIARVKGGKSECASVPKFSVDRFDTEGQGWGDAPLDAQFTWQITNAGGDDLTCEFDLDADGAADHVVKPCPNSSAALDELPARLYATPGKARPELVVTAGERRLWAATTVYANRLEFKQNVRFPEQAKGFVDVAVTVEPPGQESEVVLGYESADHLPAIVAGDVIIGKTPTREYMLTATKVIPDGDTLIVRGSHATLEDVIAGGFYGIRDIAVDTSGVRCVEDCIGTVTPVAQLPTPLDPVDQLFDDEDGETRRGVKFTYTLQGGGGEVEVFSGIVIKNFELGWDLWEGPSCDMDVKSVFEGAISVVGGDSKTFHLGKIWFGALPTAVPITFYLRPRLDIETAFKATFKLGAEAPARLQSGPSGLAGDVDVVVTGDAERTEGIEISGESRVALLGALTAYLGMFEGPYLAPFFGGGYRITGGTDCELCATVFVDGGVELGWFLSWFDEGLFEPIKFTLAEREVRKVCTGIGICEPEPEPDPPGGPGGGCWGDVHVISHDGLLFDFQAGGEFVLMRATSGAPLDVQARLSPMGDDLAVSVTTAVATRIGDQRVALHTDRAHTLHVDGVAKQLAPAATLTLAAGKITRDAGSTYTLTYPTGERMRVKVVAAPGGRDHLNVTMDHLLAARANAVEGLLGDDDGAPGNDLGLGGETYLPQPLSLAELYGPPGEPDAPGSFANRWRVPPGASLFDYDADESAATYRAAPYSLMPSGAPGAGAPHAALAQQACATCPADLRDTCMLDVGYTGDVAFAAACHQLPIPPAATTIPGDGPVIVSPRYGATLDCDGEGNAFTFVAPGVAELDQMPTAERFILMVDAWLPGTEDQYVVTRLDTSAAEHQGFEPQLECAPIGDGTWGECTLRLPLEVPPCVALPYPIETYTFTVLRVNGEDIEFAVTSSFPPPTVFGG